MSTVERRQQSTNSTTTTRAAGSGPSPANANIHGAAALFVDTYLDALRSLRPEEVRRWPCFGYGRGGIAFTLMKAGMLRADRELARSAMEWATAGVRSSSRSFLRGWPRASFSLGLTGLHAVHALAARVADDEAACKRALRDFVASARRGRGSIELFQGTAGRLAGAAIVMRGVPDPDVRALGDELGARVVDALDAGMVQLKRKGVAHGYPGVVLGALAWQAVSRSLPEDALRRAVMAAYPYEVSPTADWRQMDWAHGYAGMALLFARAYVQLGDPQFLAWAREAASRLRVVPNCGILLLDGMAGIAYCLRAVAAADPDGPWRDLVWTFAAQVFARVDLPRGKPPYGLWSGLGGVCCLALDLIHESEMGFPGFEA